MDPDGLRTMFRQFHKVGMTAKDASGGRLLKLAASIQSLLRNLFKETVASHCNEPLMVTYISDGWARLLHSTVVRKLDCGDSHLRVCRNGKLRREFLLQRAILRCDSFAGEELVIPLLAEPRGCKLGASVGNVFTASCEFLARCEICVIKGFVGTCTCRTDCCIALFRACLLLEPSFTIGLDRALKNVALSGCAT